MSVENNNEPVDSRVLEESTNQQESSETHIADMLPSLIDTLNRESIDILNMDNDDTVVDEGIDFDNPFEDDEEFLNNITANKVTEIPIAVEVVKEDDEQKDEYDSYEPQKPVNISLRDVIDKMKMGYTRTPETKGYDPNIGSIQENYGLSKIQINELYKHPKLKYAKTSFRKKSVNIIDDIN